MIYTNNLNLPDALVVALMKDDYNPGLGQYTPSSLNKPAYQKKLETLFEDTLVQDVSDNFHLMMGSMVHNILETADDTGVQTVVTDGVRWVKGLFKKKTERESIESSLREVRVYAKIGKYLIGMQFDHLAVIDGILQDYKNTTTYKFKKNYDGLLPDAPEWAHQLNIGAFILRNNPMVEKDGELVSFKEGVGIDPPEIKGLQIIGLLKDFSKIKAKRESGYPRHPVAVRDIGFLSDEEVISYVNSRGDAHEFAKTAKVCEIIPCSEEEVWAKPTKYAVMKTKTAKKSSKNCNSEDEARAYLSEKRDDPKSGFKNGFIQVRLGERTRCDGYCDVADKCPAYSKFLDEQGKNN